MNKFLAIFALLLMCGSCGSKEVRNISAGDVVFVDEFPTDVDLKELDFTIDEIGLRSVKVVDSLIVLAHSSFWTIHSDTGKSYGKCLGIGQGPTEFNYIPTSTASAFITYGDTLYSYLNNCPLGKIMRLNVTKFVNDGIEDVATQLETDVLKSISWQVTPCDSSRFILAMPNKLYTGFTRQLFANGELKEIPGTETLSEFTVEDESKINMLAKTQVYNPDADMMVEAMCSFNQLHVYAPDGSRMKTICVGKKLDNAIDIANTSRPMCPEAYKSAAAWPTGFGAVYAGATRMSYQMGTNTDSDLQFFDWNGNPKCKAVLPYKVRSIDIDFNKKRLYVIDEEEDCLRTYDATEIINALNS